MFEAQFLATRAIATEAFVDGEPAAKRTEITPERASAKVKKLAKVMGADLIGIGPLRREWVYSHVGRTFGNKEGFAMWGDPVDLSGHTTAISMGFEMDYGLMRSAPDFPILLATARGYALGAWVSTQLARYIRMLGHSARAHHMYNYRLLSVPVAVDCGLGELSRAGYLITREYGLGLRLATVTTDMPLAHDGPVDLAAQSFCDRCKICAENCPIGAIPDGDKTEFNGIAKWKLDEEKCYRYWHAVGTDCSLCMITCPWTKPRTWLHRLLSSFAVVKGPHQSWLTKAEKLFYGKFKGLRRPGFIDPYGH
jgi:ferredoxin